MNRHTVLRSTFPLASKAWHPGCVNSGNALAGELVEGFAEALGLAGVDHVDVGNHAADVGFEVGLAAFVLAQ